MTDHASLFSLFSSLHLGLKLFICTFLLLQPSLSPWYCNADVSHTVAENFHWRQLWKRNMRDWKEDHEKDRNSGGRNRSLHIYILIVKFRSKALKYEHFNGTGWSWTLLLYAFRCTVAHSLINSIVSNLNWQQQLKIAFVFGTSVLCGLRVKINGFHGKKKINYIKN